MRWYQFQISNQKLVPHATKRLETMLTKTNWFKIVPVTSCHFRAISNLSSIVRFFLLLATWYQYTVWLETRKGSNLTNQWPFGKYYNQRNIIRKNVIIKWNQTKFGNNQSQTWKGFYDQWLNVYFFTMCSV